jgi:hypothetical protein
MTIVPTGTARWQLAIERHFPDSGAQNTLFMLHCIKENNCIWGLSEA